LEANRTSLTSFFASVFGMIGKTLTFGLVGDNRH
jgi:hypothetical protein